MTIIQTGNGVSETYVERDQRGTLRRNGSLIEIIFTMNGIEQNIRLRFTDIERAILLENHGDKIDDALVSFVEPADLHTLALQFRRAKTRD